MTDSSCSKAKSSSGPKALPVLLCHQVFAAGLQQAVSEGVLSAAAAGAIAFDGRRNGYSPAKLPFAKQRSECALPEKVYELNPGEKSPGQVASGAEPSRSRKFAVSALAYVPSSLCSRRAPAAGHYYASSQDRSRGADRLLHRRPPHHHGRQCSDDRQGDGSTAGARDSLPPRANAQLQGARRAGTPFLRPEVSLLRCPKQALANFQGLRRSGSQCPWPEAARCGRASSSRCAPPWAASSSTSTSPSRPCAS